jgi:predicted nuclease of predicted toxin-antitoxin system
MRLLIDMNLSPDWVDTLAEAGRTAVHWQSIGDPRAKDNVIMSWARSNGYIIFTNDLDFGTLLAITRAQGPSVIQARTQDVMPQTLGVSVQSLWRSQAF